ncbi:MAG: cation:proton antiporter [Terriglobales bacterium]
MGFGTIALLLFFFVSTAQTLGYLFTRLRQPRVVGEILAGVLLGPVVLGYFAPAWTSSFTHVEAKAVLGFVYNLGLILLMFASGAETHGLFSKQDRRQVGILGLVGTGIPFAIGLAVAPFLHLDSIAGKYGHGLPLTLVLAIAVAVTSIPVISKILHDLKILHTRFSRLVLGVAVLEDIGLWAVLALATALAKSGVVPQAEIARHVLAAVVFFATGLFLAPPLIRRLNHARWNVLAQTSPVAYTMSVLLGYVGLASIFDVSLVFAAFLAGYAIVNDKEFLGEAIDAISKFSFAVFIPVYFAVVGYRLDLAHGFPFFLLAVFLLGSCVLKLLSAGAGARLAGFNWFGSLNLAAALNARGGPGIVLASVAFDAGIINVRFYTVLVMAAVLTSQAAGAWLDYVLKKDLPLLGVAEVEPVVARAPVKEAA